MYNIKEKFNNSPIRYKLMVISMITSMVIMLTASIFFTVYNVVATKRTMVNEFTFVSEIIGSNIAPYIEFSQKKSAEQMLSALSAKESILLVCTYDNFGKLFTEYDFSNLPRKKYFCPIYPVYGYQFHLDSFTITKNIIVQDTKIGSIYIISDLRDIKHQVFLYFIALIISLVFILVIAYLVSLKLQKIISIPIKFLVEVTKEIQQNADYSVRAEKLYDDETGELVDSFNQMLGEVEKRDNNLLELNNTITEMVDNLGQGFLTFTEDGRCGKVYSKTCETLFGVSPAHQQIEDVLKLDAKQKNKFAEWLELVFSKGHALQFDDMKIFAPSEYKHAQNKRITLDYKAIYNSMGIEKIILIATDETKILAAENLVKKYRRDAETITKISSAKEHFINYVLHIKEVLAILTNRIEEYDIPQIRFEVHTIKGTSAIFVMDSMVDIIHNFENDLKKLGANKLDYNSFHEMFGTYINKIKNELDKTLKLAGGLIDNDYENQKDIIHLNKAKLYGFSNFLKENNAQEINKKYILEILTTPFESCFAASISEMEMLASKSGKEIEKIIFTGEPGLPVIKSHYNNLILSFTHICRNIIAHGIESPDTREKSGKNRNGRIEINIAHASIKNREFIQIKFSDDGNGIEPEAIRNKLKSINAKGNWQNETDEEVIQHIFDNGFSTRNKVSLLSGQGVGMSAIKQEVEKLGGSIWVESKAGIGTDLNILVPYLLDV